MNVRLTVVRGADRRAPRRRVTLALFVRTLL